MHRYLKAIKKRSFNGLTRAKNACYALFAPHKGALCEYSQKAPSPQQTIDLFAGEWLSVFPPPHEHLKAGIYPLFQDIRLTWAMNALGGIEGKKIIELGPLEGGHSYMLEKRGAREIIAVEANPRAFMKSLLIKQLFRLQRTDFLFGDFNAYLEESLDFFDVCIASGVLYHMQEPIKLLHLIGKRCKEVFLWTQYYDEKVCSQRHLKGKFLPARKGVVDDFAYTLYPFKYGASRFWSTFIGGPARTSCWLSRNDILAALQHFGFVNIQVAFDEIHSTHGPSFALVAKKK